MQKIDYSNDPGICALVGWLQEKGFDEAARAVEQASEELVQRMDEAAYAEWLYRQAAVAKAKSHDAEADDDIPF